MGSPAGQEFGAGDAREWIAVPGPDDDKYSRGVVGFVTGSARYPGAAVLGVEAAMRTGVGMVRYLGPGRPTRLVLGRRPEAVTSDGRVQAWVLGSGQDATERDDATADQLRTALAQDVPVVIDSGVLDLAGEAAGPAVLTPHAGELAKLLGVERSEISGDPASSARRAADEHGATVLLKGHTSYVASPGGSLLRVTAPTTWLATAGSGDALAGILGALIATHATTIGGDADALAHLAGTACVLHGAAGLRASGVSAAGAAAGSRGGPFTVLALCAELPAVVAELAG
ncbi:MAG: ADP/ATP-dependent (S)-NAD(P)H-hydrate dehydratase [Pseudolysinimonas sp.]